MNLSFIRIAVTFLLMSIVQAAQSGDDKVMLNFVNSDIESTIKAAGVITGKNFVIDPRIKGTVNIVSNQPVDRDLIYPILLSALRRQGFAAVEEGSIVKIVPEAEAKVQGGVVLGRKERATGGRVLTQIFPLKYESAAQLAAVLRPLVSPSGLLNPYAVGNTLVVTDYAENVARISATVEMIDRAPSSEFVTLRLKYGSAFDVAQMLGKIMPEVSVQGVTPAVQLPDGIKRTIIVPDQHTNSLLVRSEAEAHIRHIRGLLNELDQPSMSGKNIHVVYLRNADATHLAETLKGILTGQGQHTSAMNTSGSNNFSGSATGGISAESAASNSDTTGKMNSMNASSTPQVMSEAVNVVISGASVRIQADNLINALIITAPDHIYNNLRAVIDQLDMRRAQVYVEALIAEVNLSKLGEFGIQWVGFGGNDSLSGGIISAVNPLTSGVNITDLYAQQVAGKLGGLPPGGYVGIFNGDPTKGTASLGALASAIEKSGDGNVLSVPNLLMLDNEEARIIVGQNIPIITGSYTTTASGSNNPFTTVDRRDIGIKLKVRPQVSDGGTITLLVSQEVSSIDNTVTTNGSGIVTKMRTLDTKVLVDDGQTIVLGGLIQDNVEINQSQVPLLGDIPWLGNLFKFESRNHQKVNLMVFLRPRILRDSEATSILSNQRYQYLRAEQGKIQTSPSWLLPDMPSVELPSLLAEPSQTPVDPVQLEPEVKEEYKASDINTLER